MSAIPGALGEITTSWLTAVLAPSLPPGTRVMSIRVEQIGADFGFASQLARVALGYEPPGSGPSSLVVKLPEPGRLREARFYRDVGDYAGPRVPHCWFAGHDEASGRSVLVFEDLAEARFGDEAAGCTPAEAGLVMDALAVLHGRWWGSPRLAELPWLPAVGATVEQRLEEFPGRLRVFLTRCGDLVPDDVRALSARIRPRHAALLGRLEGPPETLLHVDTHADNVAFLGGQAVLFDWEGAARGRGALDVALFLASALHGGDRREEPGLLARYHRGLVAGGVAGYPERRLQEDHRLATLRWWLGVVGGLGSPAAGEWTGRQADLARLAVPRWAQVVRDRDLASLL